MPFSGMLRHEAVVRTDASEERSTSIIRVTRIGELGTTLPVTNVPSLAILVSLMMEVLRSSETSVLTRVPWRNILENGISHGHRHENLNSYIVYVGVYVSGLVSC
jgi:hypothetical protein